MKFFSSLQNVALNNCETHCGHMNSPQGLFGSEEIKAGLLHVHLRSSS